MCSMLLCAISVDFYPRPPRGGRRAIWLYGHTREVISIHALREEGDNNEDAWYKNTYVFLSTPSARRATSGAIPSIAPRMISIHALREEGDLVVVDAAVAVGEFLSTPSARRAT